MAYAIKAKMLIDGTGSAPLEHALVLVEGNRVTAAGKQSEIKIPEGFTVIDASDKTLLPGFIDAHVHVQSSGDPAEHSPFSAAAVPPGQVAIHSLANSVKSLHAGFTTLRNCGTEFYADIEVRSAIARGDFTGPRLWCSGVGLTTTGGHMDRHKNFAYYVHMDMPDALCDSPCQARQSTLKTLNKGADFIKLNITISENVRRYGLQCAPEMPKETMAAVIETAHWHDRKVTAHSHGGVGVTWALEAGIDGLEHAYFLDDVQLETMAKQGTVFCPTISAIANSADHLDEMKYPPELRDWRNKAVDAVMDTVARAKKKGVKIVAGTDALMPYCYHGANATEMAHLVKCGLSPMEAIAAATGGAAEGIGIPDVGFVRKGKFADLVLFDGNPLDDITSLQNKDKIALIMADGKIVVNRIRSAANK